MNAAHDRRDLLRYLLAGACMLARGARAQQQRPSESASGPAEERWLELYNTHTRETVRAVYRRDAQYDPDALAQLRHVLRDHRNGESHDMDAKLYDQLYELARAADCEPHYEIISGYRSPESNAQMAARPGSGVSKRSLHMEGRAIDVRLRGCSIEKLRDLALAAKRGGVGYYQRSKFVHIDTGRFRTWTG